MNWQERAEKAEAELARLREQEPAGYVFGDWRGATTISAVKDSHFNTPLYAEPIPAPAVPGRLICALKDLKARAYKQLVHGKGKSVYIDSNTAIDIADALLQSAATGETK